MKTLNVAASDIRTGDVVLAIRGNSLQARFTATQVSVSDFEILHWKMSDNGREVTFHLLSSTPVTVERLPEQHSN